jgi:DNA-binding CsgD family transcriptional regulator
VSHPSTALSPQALGTPQNRGNSIAFPAFVCGRRWALVAAALISVGAIGTAAMHAGWSALNSVGQGTVGYFVWALVLAGLAERFAQLTMRMPQGTAAPAAVLAPIRVPNLAEDSTSPSQSIRSSVTQDAPESMRHTTRLTARQLQVVALLVDGLTAEEIGESLGIARSTVYRYVQRAKERTGVASRSELVALAVSEGLVPR